MKPTARLTSTSASKTVSKFITRFASWLVIALACLAAPAQADEYTDVGQLLRSGKLAEAMTKADAYLVTNPRDPQMRFLKGVIQRDAGKPADAIATFTKLTEDYPELPEPYNNLAVLYAGQSQFDKARAALEMAIRTNPSYATAHENLGDVYAKLASQAYNKALQLDSANVGVPPKLALIRELFNPTANSTLNPTLKGQRPAAALPTSLPGATAPAAAAAVPAVPAVAAAKPASPATFVAVAPAGSVAPPKPSTVPAIAPSTLLPAPPTSPTTPVIPSTAAAAPAVAAAATVPAPARPSVPDSAAKGAKDSAKNANKDANKDAPKDVSRDVAKDAKDAELAVRAWAAAWSAKDMSAYFAAYGKEFSPPANQPRRAWEDDRRARITSKASISVKLENLTVAINGNKAVAKFRQDYKAAGLAVSSRKTLDLVKTGSVWLIARESTGA